MGGEKGLFTLRPLPPVIARIRGRSIIYGPLPSVCIVGVIDPKNKSPEGRDLALMVGVPQVQITSCDLGDTHDEKLSE